jgi:hypothetical protein
MEEIMSKNHKGPIRITDRILMGAATPGRALIVPDYYDIDKWQRRVIHQFAETLPATIARATLLIGDSVQEYQDDTGELNTYKAMSGLILPDEHVFIDIQTDKTYPNKYSEVYPDTEIHAGERIHMDWGVYITAAGLDTPIGQGTSQNPSTQKHLDDLLAKHGQPTALLKSIPTYYGYNNMSTAPVLVPVTTLIAVDEDYAPVWFWAMHHKFKPESLEHDLDPTFIPSEYSQEGGTNPLHVLAEHATVVAFATLSMLNTKGVEAIDVSEQVGRPDKWYRRQKINRTVYKVLDVDGDRSIVKRLNRDRKAGDGESHVARHFVRRHQRVYKVDRPHVSGFVGRMMIKRHARGNREHGKVIKDYRPIPPKPKPEED